MHQKNHTWQKENLTYDLAEGHNIMLEGSMNGDLTKDNVVYDLAEGHKSHLKGSMNDAYHLLSLRQGDDSGHGNTSSEKLHEIGA